METLLKIIFPPKCVICGVNYGYLCIACVKKLRLVERGYCIVCDKYSVLGATHPACFKKGMPQAVFSTYFYEDKIRKAIKMSKYSLRQFSVLKALSYEAARHLKTTGFIDRDYLLVPIPISDKKRKIRGFNQADVIVSVFAKELKMEKSMRILKRVKDTSSQYENTRKERFENLKSAFSAHPSVAGRHVLLIDDICTSGATFIQASKELYAKGAASVKCYSLAKKFKEKR